MLHPFLLLSIISGFCRLPGRLEHEQITISVTKVLPNACRGNACCKWDYTVLGAQKLQCCIAVLLLKR